MVHDSEGHAFTRAINLLTLPTLPTGLPRGLTARQLDKDHPHSSPLPQTAIE